MNLVRFNPSLLSLFDNIEKSQFGLNHESNGHVPSVNIIENDQNFVLELAAPGKTKEDFKVNIENQLLTISSEMKEENKEEKTNYTRREFLYNGFSRSFNLPKNILIDEVSADYNSGILRLTLPKREETKLNREIKIG
ncbi:MAG: Hsp20/alpha crystallin family protein [Bacteroidales bacterium]|nr:Hsp20/alpha crystallin family protein [Bacteroidales bacterium]